MEFKFCNMSPDKGAIVFTWDDNSVSHGKSIAPIFLENGKRCTFYINPSAPDFAVRFSSMYQKLSSQGFEIGSHGSTHQHLSPLPGKALIAQLKDSQKQIESFLEKRPVTFAFPHHDYDAYMLSQARNLYFETRNSLYLSNRFSLKTDTLTESVDEALTEAEVGGYTLVFSGHGAYDGEYQMDAFGYEPVSAIKIQNILKLIEKHTNLQVYTFEQAALKTYLLLHGKLLGETVYLDNVQMAFLNQYGLTKERISDLI